MRLLLRYSKGKRSWTNPFGSSWCQAINASGIPLIKPLIVKASRLLISGEFVTTKVFLLPSLFGLVRYCVMSQQNELYKGTCPCTYSERRSSLHFFIPFPIRLCLLTLSHNTTVSIALMAISDRDRASLIHLVTTDSQTGKIPLYTLANTSLWVIVMSHPDKQARSSPVFAESHESRES